MDKLDRVFWHWLMCNYTRPKKKLRYRLELELQKRGLTFEEFEPSCTAAEFVAWQKERYNALQRATY